MLINRTELLNNLNYLMNHLKPETDMGKLGTLIRIQQFMVQVDSDKSCVELCAIPDMSENKWKPLFRDDAKKPGAL